MAQIEYRRIKAIEKANKERILQILPNCPDCSGIYILTRTDEYGFKFAYIGQAKHILTRLSQHLSGYQHIDLSIKKHKLFDKVKNPYGWQIDYVLCDINRLDEEEKNYIRYYASNGYQLRNKTIGGQGDGKNSFGDAKSNKGYRDGLAQGYKNAQKYISNLFQKHLNVTTKKENPGKLQKDALKKFEDFIDIKKEV